MKPEFEFEPVPHAWLHRREREFTAGQREQAFWIGMVFGSAITAVAALAAILL